MANVFQAATTQATTKQQMSEHLAKHLTVNNGQAPDATTIERIVNAKEKPAPRGHAYTTPPFNMMR